MTFFTKVESVSSFLTFAQSGDFPSTIITALITVSTAGGGEVKALISAMYFLSRLSRAFWASRRAGSAFFNSLSASAANSIVSSFSLVILTVCSSMKTYFSSATFLSLAMLMTRSSHYFWAFETSILLISASPAIFSTVCLA